MAQVDLGDDEAGADAGLQRGDWLRGQNRAFRAALDGAPLAVSLGLLGDTAIAQLGEDVRYAFYLADPAGTTLRRIVGTAECHARLVNGLSPATVVTPAAEPRGGTADPSDDRGNWSFPIETEAGEFVGTFALYFPTARDAAREHVELAQALAASAALIIAQQRSRDAVGESVARQAFLLGLSDRLRSEGDPQAVMAAAAELFARQLGVSVAHYLLLDADGDRFEVAGGYSDGRLPVTSEPVGRVSDYGPDWGPQFRAGQAVFFDDSDERSPADAGAMSARGIRSGSAVPLMRGGRVVAILATADPAPRTWTAAERALQHEVAERTWAAVEQVRAESALRESEDRYRRLFESMDEACAVVEVLRDEAGAWSDFRFVDVNPAFVTHTGMPYPVDKTARELLGEPNPRWAQLYGQALDTGRPLRIVESEPTLQKTFDLNIFSLDGEHNRVAVLFTDITVRARAEESLRESRERLRLIVENARDYAIFTMDRDARITDWRGGAEEVFGYSFEEMIGRDADILFTPEDNAASEPAKERARAARTGKAPNVRWHVCKDGRQVFIEGVCTALHDASGKLTGYLKIGRDATERHAAEQRQQMLLAELQHRVRNILFVIRSVFTRTLEGGGTLAEMAEHFQGRLDALARTQVVVTQNPRGFADLENLVREELLSVGAGDGPQVVIEGPEVELTGEVAEALGLVIHELTTNSIKYGAMRCPAASVKIRWAVNANYGDLPRLEFSWEEQGVPVVAVDPPREGFGTELITRALPYRLRAQTCFELRPGGVRCVIDVPLASGAVLGGAN